MNPVLAVSRDGAWLYDRDRGWQPIPGAHPLPPRIPTPMRHVPLLPVNWTRR